MKLLELIEVLGVAAFAMAGAIAGIKKRLDLFGVLIITVVTCIGGGTIRDLLLGSLPVAWMLDTNALYTMFVSYLLVLFFYRHIIYWDKLIFWLDTIGLALFFTIALEKGISFGMNIPVCIALGTITGCFGGVIRDMMLNEIPLVFRKDIYASACIAGGIAYFAVLFLAKNQELAQLVCGITVAVLRVGANYYQWKLPLLYKKSNGL